MSTARDPRPASRARRLAFPCVLLAALLEPAAAAAQVTAEEYHAAVKVLASGQTDLNLAAFADALETVIEMDDDRAIRTAVTAYSRLAPTVVKKFTMREFIVFHGQCAGAFRALKSVEAASEFKKLARSKDWQTRLLLLDASAFAKPISLLESCLQALRDDSPIVVRRALHYLRKGRKASIVDAIIQRYVELSNKRPKGDRGQWERTLLTFQSTLHEMLKVNLASPIDYKTYFDMRRDDPSLFDPPKSSEATGISLFGAAVTGKNIIFVLDTSGSMMTTDPRPPGEEDSDPRGRTGVGDPSEQPDAALRMLERQRMHRAKKELAKVVRALPADIQFNLITFDSSVKSWKGSMVPASDANKKDAVAHIEGLNAEGITFTDMALEAAFADLELDTIYLLTDGAPTHVGTTHATGSLPPDSADLIREILERVEDLNYLRGVRVFTLGFIGAEEDFLKKLAADNAGTYVPIR